jgi:hypothetical protein
VGSGGGGFLLHHANSIPAISDVCRDVGIGPANVVSFIIARGMVG